MRRHVFLDFDDTLFDDKRFLEWTDDYLSKRFNLVKRSFLDTLANFSDLLTNGMSLYQYAQHIEEVAGRSWSYISAELEREAKQRDLDFCYPESHTVLKKLEKQHSDLRILTFGLGDYQRFKIHMCRLLRNTPLVTHVVDEPKREFLDREFPNELGVLVDDKYPLSLPPHWQHVWINRKQKIASPKQLETGVWQIHSLHQLPGLLGKEFVD